MKAHLPMRGGTTIDVGRSRGPARARRSPGIATRPSTALSPRTAYPTSGCCRALPRALAMRLASHDRTRLTARPTLRHRTHLRCDAQRAPALASLPHSTSSPPATNENGCGRHRKADHGATDTRYSEARTMPNHGPAAGFVHQFFLLRPEILGASDPNAQACERLRDRLFAVTALVRENPRWRLEHCWQHVEQPHAPRSPSPCGPPGPTYALCCSRWVILSRSINVRWRGASSR